jgi:hypothetical protein
LSTRIVPYFELLAVDTIGAEDPEVVAEPEEEVDGLELQAARPSDAAETARTPLSLTAQRRERPVSVEVRLSISLGRDSIPLHTSIARSPSWSVLSGSRPRCRQHCRQRIIVKLKH